MKIQIPQHGLLAALTIIQRLVANTPPLPILGMVKIEAQKGVVHLYATDLVAGIHSMVLTEVAVEGACVVPVKSLYALISSLAQEIITIETEPGKMHISATSVQTTLHTGNVDEFPEFPSATGQKIVFSKPELKQITTYVAMSASKDQVRPVLASVCFSSTKTHCDIVGTDGFRLSLLRTEQSLLPTDKLLIPAKSLLEIERITQSSDIEVIEMQVSQEQQTLLCTIGNVVFFSRLVSGEYPPYAKIVPSDFTTTIQLQKSALEENVKRSLLFSQQNAAFVQLDISELGVKLTSKNTLGEVLSADLVSQQLVGQNTTISFNSRYVLDYLKLIPDEFVELAMTDPLKPAQFRADSQPHLKYIVMPFRAR